MFSREDDRIDIPAKYVGWVDTGRCAQEQQLSADPTEVAIERNSAMLLDLLQTALEFDARITSLPLGDYSREQCQHQDVSPGKSCLEMQPGKTEIVRNQMRLYVRTISEKYHPVGFHSWEHASHVMESATKIVYMLQSQSQTSITQDSSNSSSDTDHTVKRRNSGSLRLVDTEMADTIYDPWLHFAISFAALLHDVDHRGLPNATLMAEHDPVTEKYGDPKCLSSYAEWNSADIGLNLLLSEQFSELYSLISNQSKFCNTVRNLILCTDIASKPRRDICMRRWDKACTQSGRSSLDTAVTDSTTKQGITKLFSQEAAQTISEQIMLAADVSHTMQHFEVFMRWNGSLYHEILAAFECGRTEAHYKARLVGGVDNAKPVHPKENWFASQIGFYDFYIIPLAERLDSSCAFGESIKFAPLAVSNKKMWIEKGNEYTEAMVSEALRMELKMPTCRTQGSQADRIFSDSTVVSSNVALDLQARAAVSLDTSSKSDSNSNSVDDTSLSGSVGNASRVSFASSFSSSRVNGYRHNIVAKKHLSDLEEPVDTSVNSILPHILVQQVIDTLRAEVEAPGETRLENAVSRLSTRGSIQRHKSALLFVDISGFTTLSQKYPVEDFKKFINQLVYSSQRREVSSFDTPRIGEHQSTLGPKYGLSRVY